MFMKYSNLIGRDPLIWCLVYFLITQNEIQLVVNEKRPCAELYLPG